MTKAGKSSLREQPIYTVSEAARYLHLPAATLRSWAYGRSFPGGSSAALLRLPSHTDQRLSFLNLVEAHVLRAVRTVHGVGMQKVRAALAYAEYQLGIDRLLLSNALQTAGGDLFIQHYGELVNLSRSGQLALRNILQAYLRRVERDLEGVPFRLHPFVPGQDLDDPPSIVIDPAVSFGRPFLARKGISTAAVIERLDAGEELSAVASDYGLDERQIQDAVLYERAA